MQDMDDSYRICWSVEDWVNTLKEAQDSPYVGYDFETCPNRRLVDLAPNKVNGRVNKAYPNPLRPEDGSQIAGIAISWWVDDGTKSGHIRSAYVGIRHYHKFAGGQQPNPSSITRAFSDFISERPVDKLLVVANLSMELGFQLAEGIRWPAEGQLHDVQIAARVLNRGVGWRELIGLKRLQEHILKRDLSSKNDLDRWLKKHRFKAGRDIWRAPVALAGYYAQDDARDTLEIFLKWKKLVYQPTTRWWWHRAPDKSQRKDLYELEVRAARDATMSCMRGSRIDLKLANRQAAASSALQSVARRWIRNYLDMPTINPGSQTQLRGILFGGKFGFKPTTAHTTRTFKKMRETEQAKIVAGRAQKSLIDYASLDVDALDYYAAEYPEHADLMFMLGVYRKCSTAMTWFGERVLTYGTPQCPDPWWPSADTETWLHIIFHRLRTVGTISGRMSSSDYNGQQVPKRFNMLLNAARLFVLLEEFLPKSQFEELMELLIVTQSKPGDESKVLGVDPGSPVVDFSVRRMFIARPNHNLRLWDLSQVELRGFAHFTGNPLLCEGYGSPMTDEEADAELSYLLRMMEDQGDLTSVGVDIERHARMEANPFDAHQMVADELDIARKPAKGINFGIIYGMGKRKLARGLGWTPSQGKVYLTRYNRKFPEISIVQARIKATLRNRGYIFDPFGRRYYLPINKAYVGLNRLIQGWAASAFKVGFVRTSDLFRSPGFGGGSVDPVTGERSSDGARVLTCIHDEQMAEVHRDLDDARLDWAVRSCMTSFYNLRVPLASSSDRSERSWDDAYEVSAAREAA